ncbi:MAG: STAS domain-containing protein [Hyphomicrobiales bacterium]
MFDIESVAEGRIKLTGRLDASQTDKAAATLQTLNGPLTADCSGLEYISSAGIGVLLETYKRLNDAGHTLTLAHLSPRIRNVFAYAGLDRVLRIE